MLASHRSNIRLAFKGTYLPKSSSSRYSHFDLVNFSHPTSPILLIAEINHKIHKFNWDNFYQLALIRLSHPTSVILLFSLLIISYVNLTALDSTTSICSDESIQHPQYYLRLYRVIKNIDSTS